MVEIDRKQICKIQQEPIFEFVLKFQMMIQIEINNIKKMENKILCPLLLLLCLLLGVIEAKHSCIHSQFSKNATRHFLNDLTDHRFLAETQVGKLRIFVDYTQVVGTEVQINTIKRVMNISANYFYNVLNVTRLPRLYYPANKGLTCNTLNINSSYVTQGTIGDMGVIVGSEANENVGYTAKSLICAYLQSDNRPIWGIMVWNTLYLKFDQVGFQEMVFVANHQLTHVLGFSANAYQLYPKGNPLVMSPNGDYFLSSARIQQQINKFYNCNSSLGLPLEDQDGTLVASHWQRKVVGNQFMVASGKRTSFLSRFTLALFQSTGWYQKVNYTYSEPSTWGKGKGCNFLNIDICDSTQFCQDSSFNCDWDSTAYGQCRADPFTGSCNIFRSYVNTVCVDENFQLKNLNSKLNALEKGGSNSRCHNSDYRQQGLNKTIINQRCYTTTCSSTGAYLFISVGSSILVCRTPGQILNPPPGMTGTLVCPKNFDNVCKNKKTCPYHCNKNGACIDGKCLCTSTTQLSGSCIDISIYLSPVGSVGVNLYVKSDNSKNQLQLNTNVEQENKKNLFNEKREYSLDRKCMQGSILDSIFGQCVKCKDLYSCENCNQSGCVACDNGAIPRNGKC